MALLNEYFTLMVDCIQKEGGMLDKFIGDAIMAFWGAPVEDKENATHGILSALAMQRELARMQDEFVSTVSHELRTPLTSLRTNIEVLARVSPPAPKKLSLAPRPSISSTSPAPRSCARSRTPGRPRRARRSSPARS